MQGLGAQYPMVLSLYVYLHNLWRFLAKLQKWLRQGSAVSKLFWILLTIIQATICDVAVDPAYQRRGIGRRILKELVKVSHKKLSWGVFLHHKQFFWQFPVWRSLAFPFFKSKKISVYDIIIGFCSWGAALFGWVPMHHCTYLCMWWLPCTSSWCCHKREVWVVGCIEWKTQMYFFSDRKILL